MGLKFTPLSEDRRTRLEFDVDDVEVLNGHLGMSGRGNHPTVRIDGTVYEVFGAPCGARCYCDAVLRPVAGTD